MTYDTQKFEASNSERQTETQRAEAAANKFFDMADRTNPHMESERQRREMFSNVGREIAQGNYGKAQRALEAGAQWDDALRGAVSEVNQIDRERTGAKPMSFDEAQQAMSGYTRGFEKMSKESGGRQQDFESAMEINNIVSDASEPGVEGIDKALEYIEGTLKSKGDVADSVLKSTVASNETKAAFLKDWEEKRAIRDALYQEKQKRVEQLKQAQQAAEVLIKERGATTRNLENLYANTGVPEDTPSRQEFLAKVQNMSEGELYFLDSTLKKIAVEFGRTRDPKMLDGRLIDLSSRSFRREDVAKRQEAEDKEKIKQIRAELGLEGADGEEIPKPGKATTEQQPTEPKAPEQKDIDISEEPVYEKITDANLEQYNQQKKEIVFGGNTWRIDTIYPDGRVVLRRDITISEAVQIAEGVKKGEVRGIVNTTNVKTKGRIVSKNELISSGQWVVEKPLRSPQNPERVKEVNEVNHLKERIVSDEFTENKSGEFELLSEVFENNAQRLIKEGQEYEERSKV